MYISTIEGTFMPAMCFRKTGNPADMTRGLGESCAVELASLPSIKSTLGATSLHRYAVSKIGWTESHSNDETFDAFLSKFAKGLMGIS